ncbi:hypothetical protein [Candidatus Zinderia endosymbiont of Aphrophora alni]|uniref:DNA-directed RNA polymerase subunit alpha n=1 Tax=Candidatus Zinderia endosymbiont of Aphrophora alni TaxID=3077951 RepID=UPI0030D23A5F
MNDIFLKYGSTKVKFLNSNFSKIIIKPLKLGYGHTLGNALRRILLSSISGYAPTEIFFHNVLHEYSCLKGIKEDVIDILLNLKGIIFKLYDCKKVLLLLNKTDKKIILASDIFLPYNVKIINPNHVIANLTLETSLKLEIVVEKGEGYVKRKKKKVNTNINSVNIGKFSLDASFSPIRRVFYEVKNFYIEGKKFDKLELNVETNGLISPKNAVKKSINKFIKHLKLIKIF